MPGWAKKLGEQIKQQEELQRQQEELRRREQSLAEERARVFALKASQFWRDFLSVVEKDLNEFNFVFQDEPQNKVAFQRGPGNRFQVRRTSVSPAYLEVALNTEAKQIDYRLSRGALRETSIPEKAGAFQLSMSDAGDVSLKEGDRILTLAEGSELLLSPFLAP